MLTLFIISKISFSPIVILLISMKFCCLLGSAVCTIRVVIRLTILTEIILLMNASDVYEE